MLKILILILILLIFGPKGDAYQVCFEGIASQEIREVISSISQLEKENDRPPPTLFTLKKRAEGDRVAILEVMHAFGFYEAAIGLEYIGIFPETTVQVTIDPGPQYVFSALAVMDDQDVPWGVRQSALNVQMGYPARSDRILDTEEQILDQLGRCGYPLAVVLDREVVVDQACKEVGVTFVIQPGPIAYFGPVCIQGLRRVKPGYIHRRLAWKSGELCDNQKIVCTDRFLQETGLFTYVVVRPAETVEEDGSLPMIIQVEEKKFRHIGAGVSYSTDESFGGVFQWSHDNLSGWGDAFSAIGEYSEVIKRATFLYARPDFFGRNQDILYSTEFRREDAPGFIEREVSLLVRISRRINKCFFFNYGGRYEWLLSTKSDHDANYHLLSLPVQVWWDTSNRLLNPTSGTTIAYFGTPYQAVFNNHIFFLKQEVFATTYQPLTPSGSIIMALSAQIGSITGQSLIQIPAPKRFYSGSSTSLRGYKYLTVSPLSGRKPIGGRSILVFQVEPRVRIWKMLYFATFFDIGNVYASPFPRFSDKWLRSAGFGLRYLTPVGPFRLDIAFPLDKRKGIDKTFQIYASIGQTF